MLISKQNLVFSDPLDNHRYDVQWIDTVLGPELPFYWGLNSYDKPTEPSWDYHMGFEIGIILKGKVNRWHGSHKQTLTRGQVWLCNAWEPHGFSVVSAPSEVLVIIFWPAALAMTGFSDRLDFLQLFKQQPQHRLQVNNKEMKKSILDLAVKFLSAETNDISEQKRFILGRLILVELLSQCQYSKEEVHKIDAQAPERILPALKLVHENYHKRVTLSEAAHACHISPVLLVRLFRKVMGIPFSDFARRSRLAAVASELKNSNTKLSSLAKKYGFSDAAHLGKVFRACLGVTPKNYRTS